MSSKLFAAVGLCTCILSCLLLASDASKKSKICAAKNWPQCARDPVNITTADYSILLSSSPCKEKVQISSEWSSIGRS